MTSVRLFSREAQALLSELRGLLRSQAANGFRIGDLVGRLKRDYGLKVKDVAALLHSSRQRLSELRRTAAAFPAEQRDFGVDFHFYTISTRAARRLNLAPAAVLKDIVRRRIDSTRRATSYLAKQIQAKQNARSALCGSVQQDDGSVLDRCHLGDYRKLIPRIPDASIKLVIADPPYGQYGRYADGKHTTVAATRRDCDGMSNAEAMAATADLFRLLAPKVAPGGCTVVFRPGGVPDPRWLLDAADVDGWECRHALVWHKGSAKLGRANEPYSISSERLLVFARRGEELINHDGSDRSDVLRFAPVRPNYATGHEHHLFEKPVALCRFLVKKHCYAGEVVFEPFGGTGPASIAACELGRRWVYCESNRANFQMGRNRIARAASAASKSVA